MSEPPVKTQRRQLLPMRAAQHLRRSSNGSSLRNQLQAALTPIPDQVSGRGRAKSGVSFRLGRGAYETTFHVDYSSNWILDSGKKSVIIAPPEEMAALAISDGSNPASRTLVRQSPFILHQLRRRVRAGGRCRGSWTRSRCCSTASGRLTSSTSPSHGRTSSRRRIGRTRARVMTLVASTSRRSHRRPGTSRGTRCCTA